MDAAHTIEAAIQELDAQLFPLTLPETFAAAPQEKLPCVVFKQAGGPLLYSHDGPAAENPMWEFRCWATTYVEAKLLSRRVVGALERIGMEVTSSVDDREVRTGTPNIVVTASGYFEWEDV